MPTTTWTARAIPNAGGGQGTLSRDTCGLAFRDQFNRSDSTPGNGWTADAGYAIVSNRLRYTAADNTARVCERALSLGTGDFIAQQTFRSNNSNSQQQLRLLDSSAAEIAVIPKDAFDPSWRVTHRGTLIGSLEESIATDQWHTVRIARESAASTLRVLRALNVPASNSVASDLDEIIDTTYATAHVDVSELELLTVRDAGSSGYTSDRDEVFVCGRNVRVTGLPTDWAVRVDARSVVTESNGSVNISLDTWALPASTLYVLDTAGSIHTFLTPSGVSAGIWGGDVYAFSQSSAIWNTRSASTASWGARGAPNQTTWTAV